MNKRITKAGTILMYCVLSVFLISTSAFAATAVSPPYDTGTINGYSYTIISEVTERTIITVQAVAEIRANANVPIGYMGGQARLFNADGTLAFSSTMTYNTGQWSSMYAYSPETITEGQYYSQSKAEFYNGDGYTTFTGYKSPILEFERPYDVPANINKLRLHFESL
ncbi:hypothetical protein [Paenibacillus sp. 32O-W]|uniref:hypothetical protein n=1 Tax=Paenibacillus sp. 32O-W TaxID=1695218 RepID=UPI0011A7AF94|nr:hypothetical protein [Paenibacillus sp. 32O-W]